MKRYEKELLERLREVVPSQVKVTVAHAEQAPSRSAAAEWQTEDLGTASCSRR